MSRRTLLTGAAVGAGLLTCPAILTAQARDTAWRDFAGRSKTNAEPLKLAEASS